MNALILTPSHAGTVAVLESAVEIKTKAVAEAKTITEVNDEFAQLLCVEILQKLAKMLKQVEESRVTVKAPVLELSRTIDSTAKTFAADIDTEAKRLNGLLNAYNSEQRRKAMEAERARQAELQRIERERIAAENAARKAQEDARKAAEAEFMAQTNAASAEAAKAQSEADAARHAAEESAAKLKIEQLAVVTAPVVAAPKPVGMQVRDVWLFEVTDIEAVYKAKPELCSLDIKRSEVNRLIGSGLRECPGLRIWQEVKTGVRA